MNKRRRIFRGVIHGRDAFGVWGWGRGLQIVGQIREQIYTCFRVMDYEA